MPRNDQLLNRLWENYAAMNPQAGEIHSLLRGRGESVVNDHIAFRTFDDPCVGVEALARPFKELGYKPAGEYTFTQKKLFARHYEHEDRSWPRVFISELRVGEFPVDPFGRIIQQLIDQVPDAFIKGDDFLVAGRPWSVSYNDYETLRSYSEYAAWMAAFGFRANHFTVDVGALKTFDGLEMFNAFIEDSGFALNSAGGKIKGSSEVFLEQSSTLAHPVEVAFADGSHTIPGCYYEFAKRHPMPDGNLFSGFVAQSADKIFQSTDRQDDQPR